MGIHQNGDQGRDRDQVEEDPVITVAVPKPPLKVLNNYLRYHQAVETAPEGPEKG
jgi:hypothetical protein